MQLPAGWPQRVAILRLASNLVKVPQIWTIFLLFAFCRLSCLTPCSTSKIMNEPGGLHGTRERSREIGESTLATSPRHIQRGDRRCDRTQRNPVCNGSTGRFERSVCRPLAQAQRPALRRNHTG